MNYKLTPYNELIESAERAIATLEDFGVLQRGRTDSRFKDYIQLLHHLRDSRERGELNTFVTGEGRHGEAYFALKYLGEIILVVDQLLPIYPVMSSDEQKSFIDKLKTSLSGPAYLPDENERNNAPRNYFFELTIGARLAQRGYRTVRFMKNPDVLVKSNGRLYPIESKRILWSTEGEDPERALLNTVYEAINQLKTHPMKGAIGGIVAIDVSRKYEWPSNVLESDSLEHAQNYSQKLLEKDAELIRRRSLLIKEAAKNEVVAGLMLNISGVYTIPEKKKMGWIQQTSVTIFNAENPAIAYIFKNDFERLVKGSTIHVI